jgi:hypothetical protein
MFGVPSEKWGETPIAAVILRQPGTVTAEELCPWINEPTSGLIPRISVSTVFTWGGADLVRAGDFRRRYIDALRRATPPTSPPFFRDPSPSTCYCLARMC